MDTTPHHVSSRIRRGSPVRPLAVAFAFCAGLAGLGLLLTAGPLNPPAGAVAPTGKTIQEVEPRVAINLTNTPGDGTTVYAITQPGSYYLTGNVTPAAGKTGIRVASSGVTIDLNGFSVTSTTTGIFCWSGNLSAVVVRNGTIVNCAVGVDFAQFTGTNCTFADLNVHGCTGAGINIGTASVVSGCTVGGNGGIGIATSSGCTITNCICSSNGAQGYLLGSGSTITGCTSYLNTGNGIEVNNGCTVANCTSYANTASGIRVLVGCLIKDNTCKSNGFGAGMGAGIFVAGETNRIEGNTCTTADQGIYVGSFGNLIIRNSCSGNTTNWLMANNNVYGPIVDRTVPGSPTVNGNSAASSLGTTDGNANFTF